VLRPVAPYQNGIGHARPRAAGAAQGDQNRTLNQLLNDGLEAVSIGQSKYRLGYASLR
jgi:hypothetical protein